MADDKLNSGIGADPIVLCWLCAFPCFSGVCLFLQPSLHEEDLVLDKRPVRRRFPQYLYTHPDVLNGPSVGSCPGPAHHLSAIVEESLYPVHSCYWRESGPRGSRSWLADGETGGVGRGRQANAGRCVGQATARGGERWERKSLAV